MQVSLVRLSITRTVMSTVQVAVGEHEIPVLESVHGEACLTAGALPTNDTVEFEPQEEYERLVRLYGKDDSGSLHVVNAYGTFRQFLQEVGQLDQTKRKVKTPA